MKFVKLILFLFTTISLYALNCPKCHFQNEDSDRYCLSCGAEMRSITDQEQQTLKELDEKRESKVIKPFKDNPTDRIVEKKNENSAFVKNKLRYSYAIQNLFQTHLVVTVTVENLSKTEIDTLQVKVKANYSNYWTGSEMKELIRSFDPPLEPGMKRSQQIEVYGMAGSSTLDQQIKDQIKCEVETVSWS